MVETKLRLRKQVRPAIGGKSSVTRRESGDEVVLGGLDGPLCRKGAVILRGGVLEREGDRAKKGSEVRRSFVVDVEEGKRVRERFEDGDDRGKGGDVGGRGAVFERGEVDIPEVNGHEYVLVPVHRFDGKTSRQVG